MRLKIKFKTQTSKLIIDGYQKRHGKRSDDFVACIDYDSIPEYIKLGKQVRRREKFNLFIERWSTALFYMIIIGGLVGWSIYTSYQKRIEIERRSENYQNTLDDSESSKSGIYNAESCPITTCRDGSCSSSTGRGTCSHHSGIAY